MKLQKVELSNFLSVEDLVLDIDRPGLFLVLGNNLDSAGFSSNGSGKTSIWHGVIYCLYNKMLREASPIRDGQNSCTVSVTLDPEDGSDLVVVTRGYNNRKPFAYATTLNTKQSLFPAKNIKDFDLALAAWLGLPYQIFVNSVYFGKSLADTFMLADDSTRKEILETILNISSFETAQDTAKNKKKQQETEKTRCKSEIDIFTDRISETNILIKKFKEEYDIAYKEHEKLAKTNFSSLTAIQLQEAQLTTEISKCTSSLSELDATYKKDLASLTDTKDQLMLSCNQELRKISQNIGKLKEQELAVLSGACKEEQDYCNSVLTDIAQQKQSLDKQKIKIDKDLAVLSSNYITEEKRAKAIASTAIGVTCSSCYQIVTLDHMATEAQKAKAILADYKEQGLNYKKTLTQVNTAIEQLEKEYSRIAGEYKKLVQKQTDIASAVNKKYALQQEEQQQDILSRLSRITNTYNSDSRDLINGYTEKKSGFSLALQQYKSEITAITKEKQRLVDSTASSKQAVEKIKLYLVAQEEKLPGYSKKLVELNATIVKVTSEIEILDFWVQAFGSGGIKSFILENALPYLSERSNYYSSFITGGSVVIEFLPFYVTKTTDKVKEKITINLTNIHGGSSYAACSSGEQKRVDFCILLAFLDLLLAQSTRVWNLLIFDELFDSLDDSGVESVIEVLRTMQDKSIFVISHNATLKRYFDNILVIQKSKGVSSLIP